MAFSNKFLSLTRAPAHGDTTTYFFSKKNRSDTRICVSVTQPPNGTKKIFRTKSRRFTDNSVGWNLAKNPFTNMCACSWRYRPVLFLGKKNRSDGGICVSMPPFWILGPFGDYVTETNISPSDRNIFFWKKYAAISPRSGAYVGDRTLLLSAIRRSWLFMRN